MPEITKLTNEIGHLIAIKKINCQVNPDICQRVGIKGYPTIIYYAPNAKKPGEFISKSTSVYSQLAYNGERDAASLKAFIEDSFRTRLYNIVSGRVKSSRQDINMEEFNDLEPEKVHCIMNSKKNARPSLELKSLAEKHREAILGFAATEESNIGRFQCFLDGKSVLLLGTVPIIVSYY